jgi:CDP-diacylglycerol--glycerol-3-phosphate 3-phosphatidyltransferase
MPQGGSVPSVYSFKPAFQGLLRPVVRRLAQHGITANQITVAALILSAIQGLFITWQPTATWPLILMPLTLLVRMALNAMDGLLAREHHLASDLGIVLNELGDLISDAILYLPLALVPGVSAPLMVSVVCLALISEATGILALQINGLRGNEGPMGKSDRAVVFGGLTLALGLGLPAGIWVQGVLLLAGTLLLVTIVNRARGALRKSLRNREPETVG